jgi:hypothetical protein
VEFVVKVLESLDLQQQPPQQCPSTRFGRRFGSGSFVKLTFSKEALEKLKRGGLLSYVQRPIVISGKVFRAYSTRDSNVFYVQTDEAASDSGRLRQWLPKDPFSQVLPFLDFVGWHNPLEHNQNQVNSCSQSPFHSHLIYAAVNDKVDQQVPARTVLLHSRCYPQLPECAQYTG